MDFKSQKNNEINNDNNAKANFFQFTREQLSVNLSKYDTVTKGNPTSLFNSNAINADRLKEKPVIYQKRLNSLDSAMLEESAYIALDDHDLKLEKKIENLEQALKEIKEKLIVADTIQDEKAKQELLKQRKMLAQKLANLQAEYKSQNLDTKLTSAITRFLNFPQELKKNLKKRFKKFLRRSKLVRRFTPLARVLMVKDTLGRLDKINKSVDELVKMHVPFGEQEARYETLVTHLQKAGALHSQILKELNG